MDISKDFSERELTRYKFIFDTLSDHIDEKTKRLLASAMVNTMGHGGQKLICQLTGLSPDTLQLGVAQLKNPNLLEVNRIRRSGGGRKPITEIYPNIEAELLKLVAEDTQGDPESPLLWTSKSLDHLSKVLTDKGMPVSGMTVSQLLAKNNYSMQANRKRFEGGTEQPGRDGQFAYINAKAREFQEQRQPIISVDTKKKELIGNQKNNGQEYRESKNSLEVNAYDFVDKNVGKAIPYGVYDPMQNEGWVNVGNDHDTAEFAVESIRQWWLRMGSTTYTDAKQLLITADGGGSNSSSSRLWKVELQKFCNETGLSVTVCHFPPGTSKWNKIEHRMFSHISMNWRARPLISHEVVVNLIGSTTTKTGLRIESALDTGSYPIGKKVSKEELNQVCIERDAKHDVSMQKWNYTIHPIVNA